MTTLAIKYVDEAKPGKKYGAVKTQDGQRYLLPAGMEGVFQPGMTVDVPLRQENWKDRETGEPKPVQIIAGRPGAAGSGVVNNQQPAPPPPRPAPAPIGHNSNGNGKDVQIATIALMKSFIETGKFGLTDLDLLEKACIVSARSLVAQTK